MLTLYHDYTSPSSAVAVARLHRLADEGVPVTFTGFEAIGVDVALPVTADVLAEIDALAGEAASEGVVLRRPTVLPPTALAHAAGDVAEEHGVGASWRDACYRAYWESGDDLADPVVLAALAVRAGLPSPAARAACTDRARLAALRRRMGVHRRAGVGGVPTILAHHTLVPGLLPESDLRALAGL